jgi:hypothetical protein
VTFTERDFNIVPDHRLLNVVGRVFESLVNAMEYVFSLVDD